jgi:hypothetical protein
MGNYRMLTRRNRKYTRKSRKISGGSGKGAKGAKGAKPEGPKLSQKEKFALASAAKAVGAAEVAAVAKAVADIQSAAATAVAEVEIEGSSSSSSLSNVALETAKAKKRRAAASTAANKVYAELLKSGASKQIITAAEAAMEAAVDEAFRGTLTGKSLMKIEQREVNKALAAEEKTKEIKREIRARENGRAGNLNAQTLERFQKLGITSLAGATT